MNRNVNLQAFGFAALFFAYHAVERHVGVFFPGATGLWLLAVGYLFLFIGDATSPIIIGKLGFRRAQAGAAFFYFLWIAAASSANPWLLGIAAIPAGFAAAVAWNGMGSYIIMGTDPEKYDVSFGKILTLYGIGASLGLAAISFLIGQGTYPSHTFLIVGSGALLATFLFFRLEEIEGAPDAPRVKEILSTYANPTVLRLASLAAITFVVFGLLVGVIPYHIQKVMSLKSIGYLSSIAFIALGLCYIAAPAIKKLGLNKLIQIAYSVLGAGLITLYFATTIPLLIIGVSAVCISYAFLFVVMFVLADLAPLHKIGSVLAVNTSIDDITILIMLVLTAWLKSEGIHLKYMYLGSLVALAASFILILPLFKGEGDNLEEAAKRLAEAFPDPTSV